MNFQQFREDINDLFVFHNNTSMIDIDNFFHDAYIYFKEQKNWSDHIEWAKEFYTGWNKDTHNPYLKTR